MASDKLTTAMKKTVGVRAARMVSDGDVVGLGTGSTAVFMIEELGRRVREEQLNIVGIPTSFDASVLAHDHCIPVSTLDDVNRIDIAVDGADESIQITTWSKAVVPLIFEKRSSTVWPNGSS